MNHFASRLSGLAQRLGLHGRSPRQILDAASVLRLRVVPMPGNDRSIDWQHATPWHRLTELPRDALAGPVQEDKANARAALIRTMTRSERPATIDLRDVEGVVFTDSAVGAFATFDDYLANRTDRRIRIISFSDFEKALKLAFPAGTEQHIYQARQASWRHTGVFLDGVEHVEALACVVIYARRRALEVPLTVQTTRYAFSESGLRNLNARYYAIAFAPESWSNPAFLSLLVESGAPYARLAPLGSDGTEYLMLPKSSAEAAALGEGLLLAGMGNLVAHLQSLHLADL